MKPQTFSSPAVYNQEDWSSLCLKLKICLFVVGWEIEEFKVAFECRRQSQSMPFQVDFEKVIHDVLAECSDG